MKIVNRKILEELKIKHADVKNQADSWLAEVETTDWSTPQDIKRRYASASFLAKNNVVFNFKGNKYRLVVKVDYLIKIVFIKNAGTHDEYIKWKII